jgi:hypothetical protein
MDNGEAFNRAVKPENRASVILRNRYPRAFLSDDAKAEQKYLKRNRDNGPSLATRQRINRANKQCLEDRQRAQLHAENAKANALHDSLVAAGKAVARWTPDPKALARKKKALQDKSMAILRALRSRAGRRKAAIR